LAVDRDLQGTGVGSELVRRIKAAAGDQSMLLVLSAPEAMGFYPKVGMEPVDNGWIIKRVR
jgi:predicted N-acetyltransferase YhbS